MIEDVGVNEMRRDEVGWNNSQVGLRLGTFMDGQQRGGLSSHGIGVDHSPSPSRRS